jgi:hypothetical protein
MEEIEPAPQALGTAAFDQRTAVDRRKKAGQCAGVVNRCTVIDKRLTLGDDDRMGSHFKI